MLEHLGLATDSVPPSAGEPQRHKEHGAMFNISLCASCLCGPALAEPVVK